MNTRKAHQHGVTVTPHAEPLGDADEQKALYARSNPGPTPVAQGAVASGRGLTAASGPQQAVSERDFQEHVLTVAALHGWHGAHILHSKGNVEGLHSPNRRFPRGSDHDDASGVPDLLLVHPARGLVLFAELKAERGRLTAMQAQWLSWLAYKREVGAYLWRPRDEAEMQRVLQGQP